MSQTVKTLLQLSAEDVTRQTIPQLSDADLHELIGHERLLALLEHHVRSANRPRQNELWRNLDMAFNMDAFYTTRRFASLVRNPIIVIYAFDDKLSYRSPSIPSNQWVSSWTDVRRMYGVLREDGVTEEELGCIMGHVTTTMHILFPDSAPAQ